MAYPSRPCPYCKSDLPCKWYDNNNMGTAFHPNCWLKNRLEDMVFVEDYSRVVSWLYTHVIPILRDHNNIGLIGVSALILETMGTQTYNMWLEVLEEYKEIPTMTFTDAPDIQHFVRWRAMKYGYFDQGGKPTDNLKIQ